MAAFLTVIPVVETIVNDIVKAIDARKSSASAAAAGKAAASAKNLDDNAAKNKQKPGTVVKAAQDVAQAATEDTINTIKAAAVAAGAEAAKVPHALPEKLYSEAQQQLSKQLGLVVVFLNACFEAEDDVIRIQGLLEAREGSAVDASDKRLLNTWWSRVSKQLSGLKEQQKATDALDDPSTQDKLSKLFDVETVDPDEIGATLQALSDKNDTAARPELNEQLGVLKGVLHEINELALTVIKDVVRGLDAASNSAATRAVVQPG